MQRKTLPGCCAAALRNRRTGLVSTTNSPPSTCSRARSNAGALTRNRFWPATGNRPREAQTYQELSPPESSLPGRPPGPVPNCQVSAMPTNTPISVDSGRLRMPSAMIWPKMS